MWPGVAPTPLCASFPILSIPLSRRHLFVAWENVEVKKRKDDILAVVVDLHRAVVFGTAWKAAPKDSRLKRTDGEIAAHNAHTFSSLVGRNLISYGWNTPPPPRRAGQVNAPAPHIHFCSNCNLQRKIKAQLTWFQNRFMVATWLWLILIFGKNSYNGGSPLCVAGRREGKGRGADVNE